MKAILFKYSIDATNYLWLENGVTFRTSSNFPNTPGVYEIESYTHTPGTRPAFTGVKFIRDESYNKDFLKACFELGLKFSEVEGYTVGQYGTLKELFNIHLVTGLCRKELKTNNLSGVFRSSDNKFVFSYKNKSFTLPISGLVGFGLGDEPSRYFEFNCN